MIKPLPYSEASDRNKNFILDILNDYLIVPGQFLDFSCGTAQHFEFFYSNFPNIIFNNTEIPENIWIAEQKSEMLKITNFGKNKALIIERFWSNPFNYKFDYLFTANTLHIMSEEILIHFLNNITQLLKPSALLFFYGPFKYDGHYVGDGNRRFDEQLKNQNNLMGIREFETIEKILKEQNIHHIERFDLPENNQLHIFKHDDSTNL